MQLHILLLLAEYLQFVFLPWLAKEMTEDEAIAQGGWEPNRGTGGT